jgi:hypothetical protein
LAPFTNSSIRQDQQQHGRTDIGTLPLSLPLSIYVYIHSLLCGYAAQVTAEVVGTGSDGTEPSLLFSVQRHGVYSDDVVLLKRYLFNCGEGTQRLCGENGIKLSSLDAMFFTRFDVHVRGALCFLLQYAIVVMLLFVFCRHGAA